MWPDVMDIKKFSDSYAIFIVTTPIQTGDMSIGTYDFYWQNLEYKSTIDEAQISLKVVSL